MNKDNEINGLLYFPALGLLVTCLIGSYNYYKICRMFFLKAVNHEHIAIWFAAWIIIGGAIYLAWSYYSVYMFFSQKEKAIKAMVIYYIIGFVLYTPLFTIIHLFHNVPLDFRMLSAIISGAIGLLIWVPYFLKSKKVARVFIK